jgi:molecular chaperone GrpE (heat shock protein)
MSDVTKFFFGFVLWSIISGIIVLFSLYQNDNKTKKKRESYSQAKNSQLSFAQYSSSQEKIDISSEINSPQIDQLQQELAEKSKELEVALQTINTLQEDLNLTSSRLELSQYNYNQLAAKFEQESQQLQEQIRNLTQQCQNLKQELKLQSEEITTDVKNITFELLQSLLTSYPTAKVMIRVKPDLPAKNLLALLKPLDNLLIYWGIETIGKPWEKVPYNPSIHLRDHPDIMEGELIYIRFVGYRLGDRILTPAKVSRTLPGKKDSE